MDKGEFFTEPEPCELCGKINVQVEVEVCDLKILK